MQHHDERGMATAEYTVGTLAAVVVAAAIFMFARDGDWLATTLRDIIERALSPVTLIEQFKDLPRFGLGRR